MDDFDIEGAVDAISGGLGLELDTDTGGGEVEGVTSPEEKLTEPATAPSATSPAAEGKPVEGTDPAVVPPPTPPATATPAPKTWRPEVAAEWDKVPPTVQAEILKREQDMFNGLESYKQDAGVGKAFQSIVKPFEGLLKQTGEDVGQLVGGLLNAHSTLTLGTPDQKLQVVQRIAELYGVNLQPTDPDSAPYVDPEVIRLRNELQQVNSRITGQERFQQDLRQQQAEEVRAKLAQEIETFAADTAANPDFELLSDDIARLIRSKEATGLREAYDKAMWLHPVTRQKAIDGAAAAQAEAAKKAQAEAAAKAAKATSTNVRTSAKNASGTATSESMDDTLQAAYRKLMGKE